MFYFLFNEQLATAIGEVKLVHPQSDYSQYILSDLDLSGESKCSKIVMNADRWAST